MATIETDGRERDCGPVHISFSVMAFFRVLLIIIASYVLVDAKVKQYHLEDQLTSVTESRDQNGQTAFQYLYELRACNEKLNGKK